MAAELPRWELDSVFPGVGSPELDEAMADVVSGIAALGELFDARDVRGAASAPDEAAATFDAVAEQLNALLDRTNVLASYLGCLVDSDSRDTVAKSRQSELRQHSVALDKLARRLTAWIGAQDLDALLARSELARAHEHMLRRGAQAAEHQLTAREEELTAELAPSGSGAWGKLWRTVVSQITAPVERDGRVEELPITAIRNLPYEADRGLRRRAYEAELAAWGRWSEPLAAAMNSIKAEVETLARRRGWGSALDESLFAASIDRDTLEALLAATREASPHVRGYLRAKAGLLGVGELAWFDLFAPLPARDGGSVSAPSFGEAADFVTEQFGAYSDDLRALAERAFADSWIDAGPRAGKTAGAYCVHIRGTESRVLANYSPSYDSVLTIAHELGHAYHNTLRGLRTPLQRRTPMTLAETASTFCETIVRDAALASASEVEQLEILEAWLQGCAQITLDIPSRFLFEQGVLERRQRRELSVAELDELMLGAQRETYGDGVDPSLLHPKMWAAKPHYYNGGLSFYNYPYLFGLLFALGLYARYREDPDGFRDGYDELLGATGMAEASVLAGRFGIDLRSIDFWRASLDVIRADVDRFVELAAAVE
jgi:pepF/M3 family oligoendopeptidase